MTAYLKLAAYALSAILLSVTGYSGYRNVLAGTITDPQTLNYLIGLGGAGVLSGLGPWLGKLLSTVKSHLPSLPKRETKPRPEFLQNPTGQFVIVDEQQRDLDALHHLAARAGLLPQGELRDKMLSNCREISDALFTYHHNKSQGPANASPAV